MTKRGQIWKCSICGNIVEVFHEGADNLHCCGKPMDLQEEKSEDPEKGEKHVPFIEGKKVKVGEVAHPMESTHYIEWIEATSRNGRIAKVFLNPSEPPEAEFDFEPVSAREYCNLHGLWKTK
jgi:superoxide reductase